MLFHLVSLLIFLTFSIPAALIDIRTFRIPDALTLPGILALSAWIGIADPGALQTALASAALCVVFFYLVRRVTGGLGLGDVKFAGFVGLFCGLPLVFPAFIIASLSGIIAALVLIKARRLAKKAPIPFGPFLVLGAVGAWVIGMVW